LFVYFRNLSQSEKHRTYPILVYAALMLAATARVLSSSPRYSLLFMPALDIFAAFTLMPLLAAAPRRVVYAALALFSVAFGIGEYRESARHPNPHPRSAAVLNYIRENRLQEKTLLVPQEDLPMIHYYFPRTHLRGYYDENPEPSGMDGILYRGYPVRMESAR